MTRKQNRYGPLLGYSLFTPELIGLPPEKGASSAYYDCSGVKRPPAGQGASIAYPCSSTLFIRSFTVRSSTRQVRMPPGNRSSERYNNVYYEYGPQCRQSAKLFLQSSELELPHPLARRRVCPPSLWFGEEGHTRWRKKGWERPNSDEGTYTVVLYIHIHICTLWYGPSRAVILTWIFCVETIREFF
jgi:hypothetical protein